MEHARVNLMTLDPVPGQPWRSAANAVAATDAEIRALEEYQLEFSTVSKFWVPEA